MAAMGPMEASGSDPIIVAETIYEAATDGTSQLRYITGDDAKAIIEQRKATDDATFLAGLKVQFGLSTP